MKLLIGKQILPVSTKNLMSPNNVCPESHFKVTKNRGCDHELMKLLIGKQILPVSTKSLMSPNSVCPESHFKVTKNRGYDH